MIYSYDRFLKTLTETDKIIKIFDNNGIVTHTINPFSILDLIVSNNILKINLRSRRLISLSFSTIDESKLAIVILREQIEQLKSKVPGFIDKQIENYVEDKISTVDINWGNGLTYNGGTVSVGGTLTNTLFLSGGYNDFIGVGFDNFSVTASIFDIVSDFVSIDSTDSLQILADNDITISANNQLTLIGDSALVSVANSKGLVYSSDYSSGFTDRSLVDKEYVDKSIENKIPTLYRVKLRSKEIDWPGYGYLYNWFAVDDSRGLANPSGGTGLTSSNEWRVSSNNDWLNLINTIDNGDIGFKLKSNLKSNNSFYGWINGEGTDDYNFSGLPGGVRYFYGTFNVIGGVGFWWTSNHVFDLSTSFYLSSSSYLNSSNEQKSNGYSVRLVREATSSELLLNDGDTSSKSSLDIYIGNDGTEYTTVKIGTQIWISQNLMESKYNDNSDIFNASINGDFTNSTWETKGINQEGAWCIYRTNLDSTETVPYLPAKVDILYDDVLENTIGQSLKWEVIYDDYNPIYNLKLISGRSWYPTQIQVTPAYDVTEYKNNQEIVQRSLIIKNTQDYITFFPVKIAMNGALTIESLNNYTGSSSDSSVYLEIIEYQPVSGSGSGSGSGGIGLDLLN